MEREFVSTVRNDEFTRWSGGAYAELMTPWSDVFRTTPLGVRADAYMFDVTSDLAANTGTSDDQMVSPKLSLAFGPFSGTEIYVSGGLGFHRNEARGTVMRPIRQYSAIASGIAEGIRTFFAGKREETTIEEEHPAA